ncbi:MAG: DRTGG domain-containing protein, partial [Thermoleophilaceae bacterium]
MAALGVIYVSGHRSPDTDSIASAIGYAELKRRLDPRNEYVPVRLGDVNVQTRWVLERSGATEPEFLAHVMLRVCDVMREGFAVARQEEPVRTVGLAMASGDLDLMPIVDREGALVGVVTERALARRYIRESREVSSLVDAPTAVSAVVGVLEGELVAGEESEIAGRVWAQSMDVRSPSRIAAGDVVVVGDRPEAQRLAIERGVALLVTSNGTVPSEELLALAGERGTAVVSSPLDTYVSARMITLAAPCSALMDRDPLTVGPEDLVADISDEVKNVHYGAALAVDRARRPIGVV